MSLSPTKRTLLEKWRKGAAVATGRSGIPCRSAAGLPPLSFAQQRLWFIDRLDGERTPFNLAATFQLSGALDPERLHDGLNEIVRRHEALRTSFHDDDGTPGQVIAPSLTVAMPRVDLAKLAEADRLHRIQQITSEQLERRFNLGVAPLFRVSLIRCGETEHVLLLVRHHILADDWSNGLFIDELIAHYAALTSGRPADLPALSVQYADYAEWQRRSAVEEWASQIAYWKQQLSCPPPSIDLPVDRVTSGPRTFKGALVHFDVPARLEASLSALGRAEDATSFMVLLAAFQLLLGRYSGAGDVWVGCPIANRPQRAVERLIGVFANTIVVRGDLSGHPTFRGFLARVRDTCLGAYAHQHAPFEQVVEQLQPGRDARHSPLVRAMFVLQNAPPASRHLPGLSISLVNVETSAAMFDVSLILRKTDSGLRGVIEYSTELFDAERIARLGRHYVRLLESIAANPDETVDRLELLDAVERREVLAASAGAAVETPVQCLHELFEAEAARRPETVAVTCGGRALTYATVDRAATALARRLQALGVGPEVPVGICLERSPELVVAILAVLKAGGAYVPLDAEMPADRLRWLLADAGAPVVVTDGTLRARVTPAGVRLVDVTAEAPEPDGAAGAELVRAVRPDNLAYIIYTSGSTGTPKGVLVTHANVVSSTRARLAYYSEPVHAFLLLSPITFDSSVAGVFWTLCSGGTLVIPSEDEAFQPASLARLIAVQSISHLLAIPSLYRVLIDETAPSSLSPLRTIVVAGEACPAALVDQHHRLLPGATLVNEYGPTEATVWSTAARSVSRSDVDVAIGEPIPGTEAYVLDAHLNLLPTGVAGELYIGGEGVTRGYVGHPDTTAARFVPDPFSGRAGSRLYRTGDRVRRRPDGQLEFLGRLDRQLKIRGVRIEPGEIEHLLRSHPGIREVAVKAVEGDEGRISAYVVASGLTAPTVTELEAFAGAGLPRALVPASFVFLDVLPRLPNGKVDYSALSLPNDRSASHATVRRPKTPTETALARIWSKLLGIERADLDASFFELGGHSLLATRMLARVRQALGVDLPLRAVFEDSSIGALAVRVDAARRAAGALPALPVLVQPRATSGPTDFPLSYAQERLWFLDRLNPGSAAYNVPTAARLTGRLDRAALSRAIRTIVARHESLRTSFELRDGRPVQRIWPDVDAPIRELDLRALDETSKRELLGREMADEAMQGFDLSRAPLLRIALLQVEDEEQVLLVTMHHIVSDAWSLNVFFKELATAYAAVPTESAELRDPSAQYADYTVWQRTSFEQNGLAAELEYWKTQLADLPHTIELPADRPRPPIPSMRGSQYGFSLSAALSSELAALSRHEQATPFMLLLAAFGTLLHRYTEQDELLIGSPVAGRRRPELEEVVGFFVNMLVLRVSCVGNPTFRELLRRTKSTCLDADAHQDVPFERVIGSLSTRRDVSRQALFQVAFAVQNAPDDVIAVAGLSLTRLESPTCTSKFDLTMTLTERAGRWHGLIEYSTDLFDADRIARLARHYVRLLESIAANPDETVDRLELLDVVERREVLAASGGAAVETPVQCLHELFEAQAARRPEAVAVTCGGRALTYAAVDRAATALARRLQALGVGPEVPVGIYLERSPELVVAILAVLKAGGAYVPLDPDMPIDRLRWLVADTGAPVVVTDGTLRERVAPTGVRLVDLTAKTPEPDGAAGAELVRAVRPDNLAYIIYTSGSTGTPKGVLVTHANVGHLFAATRQTCRFTSTDVSTLFHSAAFDFSVWELWSAWLYGGRLVVVSRDVQRSPDAFYRLLVSEGVTVLNHTPSAFRQLARIAAGERAKLALRLVIFGGEALEVSQLQPWLDRFGDAVPRIVNMYGITETTVHVTERALSRGDLERPWVSPIGRPLPHLRACILDRKGQPVPIGVPGELYVGGAGLARGYLGRPDLTAERFVPDPFHAGAGDRLYRTGDRARFARGGELEFLGRADNQLKIRGFRVESGEIEAALQRHPAVREAVVVGRRDQSGDTRLLAYVVFRGDERLRVDEMRRWLADRLPDYMMPAEFIVLDALPRTAGGKPDRLALPAPRGERPDLEREYVAPHGALERTIAAIWAEVLQVKRVGVHDNFFSLGGNSLLLAQLHGKLQEHVSPGLPMVSLFTYPTVRAFAEHLQATSAQPTGVQNGLARAGARRRSMEHHRLAARAPQDGAS